MVPLAVRNPCHGVDEGNGLVKVFELVRLTDAIPFLLPSVEQLKPCRDIGFTERWRSAFAGAAVLLLKDVTVLSINHL